MESTIHTISAAGDPFPSRQECHCFAGFVTLTEGADGEEVEFAVPCRRCNKGGGDDCWRRH
jgi:hypothetical protein